MRRLWGSWMRLDEEAGGLEGAGGGGRRMEEEAVGLRGAGG